MSDVLNIIERVGRDPEAREIADAWMRWDNGRDGKKREWLELRDYIFATSTKTTSNNKLPWKNSTTRPKLTQIRDNLHANYMATLFPNEDWFDWIAEDEASLRKAAVIKAYMREKLRQRKFRTEVARMVADYIDYGNTFGGVRFVREQHRMTPAQEAVDVYVGPEAYRVSPLDIVFDPTASSFESTPKITRQLLTLGDLKRIVNEHPEDRELEGAFERVRGVRQLLNSYPPDKVDHEKNHGLQADGFSSLYEYLRSGLVEILTFEGDLYVSDKDELLSNHRVVVADRLFTLVSEPIQNWFGKAHKFHAGWRLRPDNLWGMGPLDNLVGMQYRIDHLENLQADVFDMIAHPVLKIRGQIEDFEYGPNERIFVGEEGDVTFMNPPVESLQADLKIQILEQEMEEMAGAPKQAMGVRSPGEKTKFEVSVLENAAGRIFQNKVQYFEQVFLEPMLNAMLEVSRRELDGGDTIRVVGEDNITEFLTITKEDLTAKGKLRPMGARHFAAKAQLIQNLTTLSQTPLWNDPTVRVHYSGKRVARAIEQAMELGDLNLTGDFVLIGEQLEATTLAQAAQDAAAVESITPTDVVDPEVEGVPVPAQGEPEPTL